MIELLTQIVWSTWVTFAQMAPYLLLGFLVAGMLSVLISTETVEAHLGGRGMWPVLKAAIFGIPLPLCSCGVIPVSASLRRHGASRGATVAFLMSTPQTGVDSIMVTWGLMGPVYALFRPVAALISGLLGGALTELGDRTAGREEEAPAKCTDDCCAWTGQRSKLRRVLHYGFETLPRDIAGPLLLGVAIAGVLAAVLPEDFFAGSLGQGISGILVMMLLGIPVYVCATASVPIAAALMLKGASPGAALAFLIAGPATNAAAVATIWKVLGRRTALIYLATIAVSSVGLGVVLNYIFAVTGSVALPTLQEAHEHAEHLGAMHIAGAVALIAVLLASFRGHLKPAGEPALGEVAPEEETLLITGMTCGHCVETARKALLECADVKTAEIDLATGCARVTGRALNTETLCAAVKQAGFEAVEVMEA